MGTMVLNFFCIELAQSRKIISCYAKKKSKKATLIPFFAPYIIDDNREEITELTDATLVQRCLAGDAEAFSMLVKKYESTVYGLCYHKAGNFADAQDLAQEAFVQAYLDLPQLRDVTKFSHWLYRIASNVCNTWLRKRGRKRQIQSVPLDDALEEYGDFIDESASSPHDAVEYKELSASVAQAISALSEKNRLAVTLYYIDGLSYEEIADFLDVPQTTVKSRLNKARKQLKEEFIKMVTSDLKEHPLPDDFAKKAVQEALNKAKTKFEKLRDFPKARDREGYREVVKQCDTVLEALTKLPDDDEHKKLEEDALQFKAWSINFGAACQADVRKLQEIGDQIDQGEIPWSGYGALNVIFLPKSSIRWNTNPSSCTALHQFRDTIGDQQANLPAWQPLPPCEACQIEIPLPVALNKSWSGDEFLGMTVVSTIESLTETVEVSAGVFKNCLKLKAVIKIEEGKFQRHGSGTVCMWFAPNVGLVEVQYSHNDGDETLTQLVSYSVKDEGDESFLYFPLQVGNNWQYQGTKRSSDFVTKSIYWIAEEGVEFEEGYYWHIPYYNYALKVNDSNSIPKLL